MNIQLLKAQWHCLNEQVPHSVPVRLRYKAQVPSNTEASIQELSSEEEARVYVARLLASGRLKITDQNNPKRQTADPPMGLTETGPIKL